MGQACTALTETMMYGGWYTEARPSMGFGIRGKCNHIRVPRARLRVKQVSR